MIHRNSRTQAAIIINSHAQYTSSGDILPFTQDRDFPYDKITDPDVMRNIAVIGRHYHDERTGDMQGVMNSYSKKGFVWHGTNREKPVFILNDMDAAEANYRGIFSGLANMRYFPQLFVSIGRQVFDRTYMQADVVGPHISGIPVGGKLRTRLDHWFVMDTDTDGDIIYEGVDEIPVDAN